MVCWPVGACDEMRSLLRLCRLLNLDDDEVVDTSYGEVIERIPTDERVGAAAPRKE